MYPALCAPGARKGPEGPFVGRLLLGGALVAVVAVHQVADVEHDVLTEVGRTVELAVLVTDDDTDLRGLAAGGGVPGLQTDGEDGLGAGDLDALDERDGGDDVLVGSLGKGDRHENSQCLRLGVVPPSLCSKSTREARH
jgi:hypothetical protein